MPFFHRPTLIALTFAALPLAGAASAQEAAAPDCDRVAEIVMGAVNARAKGESKAGARRVLRSELGRTAGDELANWVYALPEEMLTDEVGAAWKSQCETL